MTAAQRRIHAAALKLFAEKGPGDVNISDLAEAAGVARGTIYKHMSSVEALFESVTNDLGEEMNRRIALSTAEDVDPPLRLANGIRHYIRRAHEEPGWGKFLIRYGVNSKTLQTLWTSQPLLDLVAGLKARRYDFDPEQLASALSMISGSVLTAMSLVQEGHKTWRDAGSDTAEFVLRALGLDKGEARELATGPLPPLALTAD
jgi:AcrR family transcriptional regulator